MEWAARFAGNFWNIICAVCTMDAHVVMKLPGGGFGFGGSSSQFVSEQRQRGLVEAAPSSSRLAGNVRVISFGKQAANLSSSTVGCSLGRTCIASKSIGDSARTASFTRNHGPPASLWMPFKVQNLLTRIYATNGAEEEASRSKVRIVTDFCTFLKWYLCGGDRKRIEISRVRTVTLPIGNWELTVESSVSKGLER